VKYEFTDVDLVPDNEKKAILAEVMKLNPECSFPTIIIGDIIIVGFQEAKIKAALGLA
jgi:glutaredoxin